MQHKKAPKPKRSSLAHDRRGIQGLWLLADPEGRYPMVIRFNAELLMVCEFYATLLAECCLPYALEKRGKDRVVAVVGNRVHTYQLDGDTLDLEGETFNVSGSGTFLLTGRYRRIQ
jgi:hypothetical protein